MHLVIMVPSVSDLHRIYGNQTPGFSGDKTANGNYRFTGWDKTIESKVTGDIVYTLQWGASSNGGGTALRWRKPLW